VRRRRRAPRRRCAAAARAAPHPPARRAPRPAGVPSEFNEFLPKDCEEYKRWKAAGGAAAPPPPAAGVEGALAGLALDGGAGGAEGAEGAEGAAAAGDAAAGDAAAPDAVKKKKKVKLPSAVVLERNTRNKKKCITTVAGLDQFGVKLAEAAKLFGKKFASGASATKAPDGTPQIDIQGDVLDGAAALIVKTYKEVSKEHVFVVEGKKRVAYFGADGEPAAPPKEKR
jgi:density-regulated protein DRP1